MKNLLAELSRRNIYRVATAYVVLGWVLLQVAGLVVPGFDLPGWTFPFVTFILILGFPLVLIFAWAFELTAEGLKRTTDVHPENSMTTSTGRMLDFLIIGVLSAALLLLVIDRLFMLPPDEQGALPNGPGVITAGSWSSIAVMPFVNMSSDPDQEYFSDGISEELLNVLSRARDLRVAARTSSFSFKGTNTAITEIGKLLNVETVLEGSVRKSGTKLRITAQLIDVATGYHIWSETYDRETRDIFDIQDEIARSIASAMSTHLTGLDETAEPKHQPSFEAYNYYLAGRRFIEQRTPESIAKAVDLFAQAITADPLFAAAYANKAEAIALLVGYTNLQVVEAEPQVVLLVDMALKLDPDLAEAYAVLGLLYSYAGENKTAIVELKRAISLNPNSAESRLWLAEIYIDISRLNDGLAEIELAYRLDPLHPMIMQSYAKFLRRQGRYVEASSILTKSEIIHTSTDQRITMLSMRIYLSFVQGKIVDAMRQYQERRAMSPNGYGYSRFTYLSLKDPQEPIFATPTRAKARLYVILGRSDEARSVLDSASEMEVYGDRYKLIMASILVIEGDFEAAVAAFEQVPYEKLSSIRYSNRGTWYAWSLIELGRQQDANQILNDIMKKVDRLKSDGAAWHETAHEESEVLLLRGDDEGAIDVLEQAYDQGMRVSVWRNYPILAPLRKHPRFVALFDKIDEDIKAARIEVGLDKPSKLVEPN